MPHYWFVWTPQRLSKLEANDVDSTDFERVVMHPESVATSRTTGRPIAFGTDSQERQIACVYEVESDGLTVHPITAFPTEQ
ncbi:MAG: hypothetical protein AAF539_10020 [Planctomycetota bacterium]